MTGRSLTAGAALMWMLAAVATVDSRAAAQAGVLPEDEGFETVQAICADCHEAERIADQRRGRAEWQTLVEDMAARNGVATEDDINVIVAYAMRHFGRVNVNRAIEADLTEIVGLAPAEAAAIVHYRTDHGEFHALEDLRKVTEVDFAKIEARKDRIGFSGP
jgi:competence ComEA-like helix-hairpin-helix protein